ncbi:MAG: type II toxin-antitoxin system RelE/ParE family toxin [Anaerolinea sp.]|nr:type II toxin-antitoxin system RelE/ParE family toxin [Anaerolinea sp.]
MLRRYLHAFKKKSQKTPPKEIKMAEKRYEILREREK